MTLPQHDVDTAFSDLTLPLEVDWANWRDATVDEPTAPIGAVRLAAGLTFIAAVFILTLLPSAWPVLLAWAVYGIPLVTLAAIGAVETVADRCRSPHRT